MTQDRKEYLQQLAEWGNDVKDILANSNFSEEQKDLWSKQLEEWQKNVSMNIDGDMRSLEDEIIQNLQMEGEMIIAEIQAENDHEDRKKAKKAVPYGQHQLPPLPYKYDALEPYISKEIMQLHHDKHHKSYVEGLNQAEKALYTKKKGKDPIKHWLREQAFHGSGHYLHTIFWFNMTPDSSKKPAGPLLQQLDKDFDSWREFKKLFIKAARSVEGDGWTLLLWSMRSHRLSIQTFEKHQLFQLTDTIPLLVLDVWEHAYYLQYKTDRDLYIDNWWNVVNWKNANDRYKEAKQVKWKMY